MSTTRLLNPTNIRLSARDKQRLDKLARKHGVKSSIIIRNAIAEKLPVWEKKGITLTRHTH